MELIAHRLPDSPEFRLEPAPLTREWAAGIKPLSAERNPGFARACQAGWVVPAPISFSVLANGDQRPNMGLQFFSDDPERETYGAHFSNHFGHSILTMNFTYHFRTPPGMGLMVRGVPNAAKRGLHPLDGLVETDWLEATFTMNWLVVERDRQFGFQRGEPMCLIQPVPLDLLEATEPKLLPAEPREMPSVAFEANGVWRNSFAQGAAEAAQAPGKLRLRLKKFS